MEECRFLVDTTRQRLEGLYTINIDSEPVDTMPDIEYTERLLRNLFSPRADVSFRTSFVLVSE